MMSQRREKDAVGSMEIPLEAFWGIHPKRAMENFPLAKRPLNPALIHVYGYVNRLGSKAESERSK